MVPSAQWLFGGQLARAQWESDRANPIAVDQRAASRTEYAHLDAGQVAGLLRRSFPSMVDRPAGGAPEVPAGGRIAGYASAHVAQIVLPGKHPAIVESLQPLAKPSGHGGFVPLNLALHATGDGYAPAVSDSNVQIPQHLSAGVGSPRSGVALIPMGSGGGSVGGSQGALEGSSVVYDGTQPETDTVVKPTPLGFQVDAILQGVESPERFRYRVRMPVGAVLVQVSGAVRVVKDGRVLATVLQPSAVDADGTPVPTSMSVSGGVLSIDVHHRSGSFLYPIDVDPVLIEEQLVETGKWRTNWEFNSSKESTKESKFGHLPDEGELKNGGHGKGVLEIFGTGEYAATEWGAWAYETRGDSKVFEIVANVEGENKGASLESFLEFEGGGKFEIADLLSDELSNPKYAVEKASLCALNSSKVEECGIAAGAEKNAVRFIQMASGKPTNDKFEDKLTKAEVYIGEPAGSHPTVGFNKTSPEVEGEVEVSPGKREMVKRANVLDVGGWLNKTNGAVEAIAKDGGVGVSASWLEFEKAGKWERLNPGHNYLKEEICKGKLCESEQKEFWVYEPQLPNGEDKIRFRAEETMPESESPTTEGEATVKVDASKPHNIVINGLPYGEELSERSYELTVEATDGEGPDVASSGIKSIALAVDGGALKKVSTGEEEEKADKCSVARGECTARAKYVINGAELGAGHHKIVVEVDDNAGTESREEEQITVHHSTPVTLGPGSVDLESGDFTLGATDVSMGSGLTVGRDYSSRATEEGVEGPLGPEWTINLGATDSLVELADGSMMLTDANGQQTIFPKTESTKLPPTYESPVGDSNLTLRVEENKTTKVREAYYLEDSSEHTKTKFTLPTTSPSNTKTWVPTVQEGSVEKSDTVTSKYETAEQHYEYALPSGSDPLGVAAGPGGRLWVTEYGTSKIAAVGLTGSAREYELPSGSDPEKLVSGTEGYVWYTDHGDVGRVTPSGEIKEYSVPSGSDPSGIAVGPGGNLWFTDYGTSYIGRVTPSGEIKEYALPSGSDPKSIVENGEGKLWFTEQGTEKIGSITTSDETKQYGALPSGSQPHGITTDLSGNLWFTDYGTSKIGELIPSTGEIKEYSLPSGSEPYGITFGPDGNLWFTDYGTNKIGKISTSGTELKEFSLPSGSEPVSITTGPDNNLWFVDKGSNEIGMITTSGTVVRPTEVRAPEPAGVSCSWSHEPTEMAKGCRALEFKYDTTETTAKGESEKEWGNYLGRLEKVSMVAWNPAVGVEKMQEIPVASYSYDKQGRLRAEWDPRLSSPLKTTYGYDQEGHVTALTPPGQESWAFLYGTVPGDAGTGRLIKATQASSTASLWDGEPSTNSAGPSLSGTPFLGKRMSVSTGTWSNSPVDYSYQWEDCNTKGEYCTPIAGANDPDYTPVGSDVGHTLVAEVSAVNGGGTSGASVTSASGVVKSAKEPISYSSHMRSWEETKPHYEDPTFMVEPSSFKTLAWVSDTSGNVVEELSPEHVVLKHFSANKPKGLAINAAGNLLVVESGADEVREYSQMGVYLNKHFGSAGSGNGEFSNPSGIVVASGAGKYNVAVVDTGNNRVERFSEEGEYGSKFGSEGTEEGEFKSPTGIAYESGYFYVTDSGNNRVERFNGNTYSTQFGKTGSGKDLHEEPQYKDPTGICAFTYEGWNYIEVADTGNNRIQSVLFKVTKSVVAQEYGTSGSGSGDFSGEQGLMCGAAAADGSGENGRFYVADTGNNRLVELSQSFVDEESKTESKGQFSVEGVYGGEFVKPTAVAVDSKGDVWVADKGRDSVIELSSSGTYIKSVGGRGEGTGEIDGIRSIAIDSHGNIWVTKSFSKSSDQVMEFNESGSFVREFGAEGEHSGQVKGADGIAVNGRGDVWVADTNNKRIDEFNEEGKFLREITVPTEKSEFEPQALSVGNGHVWVTDAAKDDILEFTETGELLRQVGSKGSGNGQFNVPTAINVSSNGDVWVTDGGNYRVEVFFENGEYQAQFGSHGESESQFQAEPSGVFVDSGGNIWVSQEKTIEKWVQPSITEGTQVTPIAGTRIDYQIPVSGSSAPYEMSATAVAKWDQTDDPIEATAIFPSDARQTSPASSYTRATIYYLDENGMNVNIAEPSTGKYGAIATSEYNEEKDVTRELSADNRATVLEASKPEEEAKLLATYYTYREECSSESENAHEEEDIQSGSRLCEMEGPEHMVKYTPNGYKEPLESLARERVEYFYNQNVPTEEPYKKETFNLLTETRTFAQLMNSEGHRGETTEERVSKRVYSGQENLGWKLRAPTEEITGESGHEIKHKTLYNRTTGDVIETRGPKGLSGESAHDTKTIYYTKEENKEYSSCGNKAEWAGLACEAMPAKQPETSGLPDLPVTQTTYNMWDEPETTTETFVFAPHPSTVRTKKNTYDAMGRLTGSVVTATETGNTKLPEVTYEYEAGQGNLVKEKTETGTISSKFNSLGQLTEYTDAHGNVAKYKYGGPENDDQVEEVSDSSNGGKSNQKYTYNSTTRLMESLTDSAAEKFTFTASYDTEGKLLSEVYPNGMCANYTYNSAGEATHLEYIKTTNCAEGSKAPVWFNETVVPTVGGKTMARESSLATENYKYDTLGRLTEVQETPVGGECTVRAYSYEEESESNRETQTTRPPGSKGECATTGGTTQEHKYDEANRLTDSGIEYESMGNITKLPEADAEKHTLTSSYYVDGAVHVQTQNSVTNEYTLDPGGRILKTISGGKATINNYDGAGEAVAWTCEAESLESEKCESGKWTRNIPGIGGSLAAVQTNGGSPVLQLADIQGNIVATAESSTTATKLISTYNSTEFGVPNSEKTPPLFAWLGAGDVSRSLSSGVVTYGTSSYVPQTGMALQTEQVETPGYPVAVGGGVPATFTAEPWVWQGAERRAAEAPGREAARQQEALEAAMRDSGGAQEDPVTMGPCEVSEGLTQEPSLSEHAVEGYIKFKCKTLLRGAELRVCVQTLEYGKVIEDATGIQCNGQEKPLDIAELEDNEYTLGGWQCSKKEKFAYRVWMWIWQKKWFSKGQAHVFEPYFQCKDDGLETVNPVKVLEIVK